jgi:hypothetical protein
MAKKWPAALSTTCCHRPLRRATSIPPYISSASMASNPPSPVGSGPYGLWLLTQLRPSSGPVEGSDWHASFEANRTVRSNYWQKSQ